MYDLEDYNEDNDKASDIDHLKINEVTQDLSDDNTSLYTSEDELTEGDEKSEIIEDISDGI